MAMTMAKEVTKTTDGMKEERGKCANVSAVLFVSSRGIIKKKKADLRISMELLRSYFQD